MVNGTLRVVLEREREQIQVKGLALRGVTNGDKGILWDTDLEKLGEEYEMAKGKGGFIGELRGIDRNGLRGSIIGRESG